MSDVICILCDKKLDGEETVVVKTGRDNIVSASLIRQDGLQEVLQIVDPLVLHVKCRKDYTRATSLKKRMREITNVGSECEEPSGSSGVTLRSGAPKFNFKTHCLFCADIADDCKEKKKPQERRRGGLHYVRTKEIINTIKEVAVEKKDELCDLVLSRVGDEIDLIAAEARYHGDCFVAFCRQYKRRKQDCSGRPVDNERHEVFLKLCKFMEDDEDCQFSLSMLEEKMETLCDKEEQGCAYHKKHLKRKLLDHFGDNIIITEIKGKESVVCLREETDRVVWDKWYSERRTNTEEDRIRVVTAAAKIIHDELTCQAYDTDHYICNKNVNDDQSLIPSSLQIFLDIIIGAQSSKSKERKKKAIAQAIISAARPRSFIAPVLLHVGVYLHRHFASRSLIDLLSSIGFSSTYEEVKRYEFAARTSIKENSTSEGFIQFAFDNADINIRTLDGHSTFHCMGGIQLTTPKPKEMSEYLMPRTINVPKVMSMVGPRGELELVQYRKPTKNGLEMITVRDIEIAQCINDRTLDILWLLNFTQDPPTVGNWSGFMESSMNSSVQFETSEVKVLPFINKPAGNPSAIFTALVFASDQCRTVGQTTCFVTFDQPLYAKAVEIASSCPQLTNVVIRLGGFHLLMSFLGAIGYIMGGSGLQELWETVYAKASVVHMMSGHAYSRAVRAHFLAYSAVASLLLRDEELVIDNKDELRQLHDNLITGRVTPEQLTGNTLLKNYSFLIDKLYKESSDSSSTGRLWIQYLKQVEIIQDFIRAERTGNWALHLQSVRKMLPYLHAAAHLHYAKSARLYLQEMESLHLRMEQNEFQAMTCNGYFTIRRSDKFWCGVSPDLAIEQDLMRIMKVSGGMIRRGVTENTLAQWIHTLPSCADICRNIEEFCGVHTVSSEQHVELRETRKKRDIQDMKIMLGWLEAHNPFMPRPTDELVSLATGLVGDNSINCHKAAEIGTKSLQQLVGKKFSELKLKRSDKVNPLSSMNKTIVIREENVIVNTEELFARIVLIKGKEEFADLLKYELSPRPPALFDQMSMRKTNKAALCTIFESATPCESDAPHNTLHVVDGGFLLHKCSWQKGETYDEICKKYVDHIIWQYKETAVVIFDGYDGPLNTKCEEQKRRSSKKTSVDLKVIEGIPSCTTQEEFLGNSKNKVQLISMLRSKLTEANVANHQAQGDADTLIVSTALHLARDNASVTIITTDTDVLVLAIALAGNHNNFVYVKHPASSQHPCKVYNIKQIQNTIGCMKDVVLFAHAATGCDTTSALHKKGKVTPYKILRSNTELQHKVKIFYDASADCDKLAEAGEYFLVSVYKNGYTKSLDDLRYVMYNKMVTSKRLLKKTIDLSTLPPTSDAARQHSFRTYHQIQSWLGTKLSPTDWGWRKGGSGLYPIPMSFPAAPEDILHIISCSCKKGCHTNRCQCKKGGLYCSTMCRECVGITCENIPITTDDADDKLLDVNIACQDDDH